MGKSNKKGRPSNPFLNGFQRFNTDRGSEKISKRISGEIFVEGGVDSLGDDARRIYELCAASMVEYIEDPEEESRGNYNPGTEY